MSHTIKIAIPTNGAGGLDAPRSGHFGHADSFTLVDIVDDQIAGEGVMVNPPHSHGGCGTIVSMLSQAGVSIAIVVGMGGGPLAAMRATGMTPLFDDVSPTPRSAVEAYLAGRRSEFGADRTCSGH